jgi:hypothetical protein
MFFHLNHRNRLLSRVCLGGQGMTGWTSCATPTFDLRLTDAGRMVTAARAQGQEPNDD